MVAFSPLNPKAGILDVRASFWTVLVFTASYWRTIKLDSCQEVSYSNMSGADPVRVLIQKIYSASGVLSKILYKHTACSQKKKKDKL